MKKFIASISALLLVGGIFTNSASAHHNDKQCCPQKKAMTCCQSKFAPYWYIGAGYSMPMMFGDMYSFSSQKTYINHAGHLKLGYKFSPIFGLEFSAGLGRMKGGQLDMSNNWLINKEDGMTYYPYNLLGKENPLISEADFGHFEQKYNDAGYQTVRYRDTYTQVDFLQFGLHGVMNLNRLFVNIPENKEQLFTLLFKPAVYALSFRSNLKNISDNEPAGPKANIPVSLGAGADLAMRLQLARPVTLEISAGGIWISDPRFDAIRTVKTAKDDYLLNASATLYYNFGQSKPACTKACHASMPKAPKININNWAFAVAPNTGILENNTPKERSLEVSTYLIFNVSKWDILPTLAGNQKELNKIDAAMAEVMEDNDAVINSISINGYASPEGNLGKNQMLSDNRAKALANYIEANYDLGVLKVAHKGYGENWDGLREAVKRWDNPARDKVLNILNKDITPVQKKAQLRRLGSAWNALLNDIYPKLRRNDCRIQYTIKPYSLEEAQKVFVQKPNKLSPEEMVMVINAYQPFTTAYNVSIEKAFALNPQFDAIRLHKAALDLRENNLIQAEQLITSLLNSKYASQAKNLHAILLAKKGEVKEAISILETLSRAGDKTATTNLRDLKR